ncbi:thiol-disulfide oxidoreductase DCC family protein [Microbulbifer yueqingensis]|uniref:Predicted thiol-disulfide oxidoreductase YuxK, DCC family n=1 Tax=Microbulbifer yueqingensis TaxID=658219 RepID=A0A1G9AJN1_9GAMM|nr:thiol-disulfide oxidoreductase DCC family protein [Microbulbifer yueqingensis]SDK27014.1 Predicted thiol-disulfide oxidoreductase YuxK, DCC family [Microbulbifer yueqingensis]
MIPSLPDRIILFDSLCNLCNGWVRYVLRRDADGIFTLCRAQSPAGQKLLESLGLPLDEYESVAYLERGVDGQLCPYLKSEAALRVLGQLPGPSRHFTWLRLVPRALRDAIYDMIARNRYRLFGRRDQCRLPDEAEKHRFLENIDE